MGSENNEDKEIVAMRTFASVLVPLDDQKARERVLDYAVSRFLPGFELVPSSVAPATAINQPPGKAESARTAKAEIAWKLGKRYVQDQPLDWGCAVETAAQDLQGWCAPGSTMVTGQARNK